MPSALIGHTGFVGGNLAAQVHFDALYNSQNIEQIAGNNYDLLVVSAMPAAKWIANGNPEQDRGILDRLCGCLCQAQARQVVVISTVDVYPVPINVDEDTPINPDQQQTYGRNRLLLEQRLSQHFEKVLVVRLPGLFGSGLKKNAIYDLLHDNELHKVNAQGVFQFYNTARLWSDIQTALTAQLKLVNFVTEPLRIGDIAREAMGQVFENDPGGSAARYDIKSKYAAIFGGRDGYLFDRNQVLFDLRAFVAQERANLP
jgi:dTDP-4-dehydrorhamnose reductase